MYKQIEFKVEGIQPTIMHNGNLANPLSAIVKEIKKTSKKRAKTDDDLQLLSDLEWIGGLYTTEEIEFVVDGYDIAVDGGGKITYPADCLRAMLISAAKKKKLGTTFKSAVLVEPGAVFNYNDNRHISKLFADPKYRYTCMVVVNQKRILRTRPIFPEWKLTFVVSFMTSELDEHQIIEAVETASYIIGLGANRPIYGRFKVLSHEIL